PRALPAGPLDLPGLSQPDDIPAQLRQPAPDVLAVDLELRLARAAGADATTKPGHRLAPATETRQEVVELGQLDLRLALPGARVQGEDVQDQRRAVDDLHSQALFEVSKLARRELVVQDHRVRPRAVHGVVQLPHLAPAD